MGKKKGTNVPTQPIEQVNNTAPETQVDAVVNPEDTFSETPIEAQEETPVVSEEVKEVETPVETTVLIEEPVKVELKEAAVIGLTPAVEVTQVTKFEMKLHQKDADGHECYRSSMIFELDENYSEKVDFIIGTAIQNLFSEMDLAKAMKTKFFDSRLPLFLEISSDHISINLGKIRQEFLAKLKVNNGERSKLAFLERIIALTNKMLQPVSVVRASQLRESAKEAVSLRYDRPAKSMLSNITVNAVAKANTKAFVNNDGKLVHSAN